jgi:hypothetical protein
MAEAQLPSRNVDERTKFLIMQDARYLTEKIAVSELGRRIPEGGGPSGTGMMAATVERVSQTNSESQGGQIVPDDLQTLSQLSPVSLAPSGL